MTKREFLETLRTQLQGELSPAQIEGHLHYYNEYITEAVASGRTESEVLEELGSPVFIAKTLLETSEAAAENSYQSYQSESFRGQSYSASGGEQETPGEDFFGRKVHTWHVNPGVMRWVVPAVLILILLLIVSILGSVVMLVARFFVPILLVVLVVAIFKSHGER